MTKAWLLMASMINVIFGIGGFDENVLRLKVKFGHVHVDITFIAVRLQRLASNFD